ncbi:hypothetical protein [Frigidibacter mobilis]|uniref:hypothetical protein n=1 Tax=Frigidibacter mobilis TaxID=1335048 RepID=UPI001411DC44|nr:hypothetical protein [Frigidibacter mobilis]
MLLLLIIIEDPRAAEALREGKMEGMRGQKRGFMWITEGKGSGSAHPATVGAEPELPCDPVREI